MKRSFVLLVAAAMVLGTAGNASAEKTYKLRIATIAPANTPWSALLKDYKRAVEKKSGGRIKVVVHLGAAMGDELTSVNMTARGQIQGVGASTGAVASLVKELAVVELPFLFRSPKEADYVLDKMLLGPMEKLFRDKGLVLGFWSENGFRHFGSTWGAIDDPGDLKGKNMRSQESFVHLGMWKALSASPQAIPATEVITALKTGGVDGFDNSLLFMIAAGWYKEIDHLTLSGHIYQPAVIAFNEEWFDALPKDLQKILIEEGRKIVRPGRKQIRAINADLLKIIEDSGVSIHQLSSAQRRKFEAATKGVKAEFRRKGASYKKVLQLTEKGIAKFR